MRELVFLAALSATLLPGPLFAQEFAAPAGYEIKNKLTFKHEKNQALFGSNPVVILCLGHAELLPTVLLTKTEALAINGHARQALLGKSVYVDGKAIVVTDPYTTNDARSELMGYMPGPISKACVEK